MKGFFKFITLAAASVLMFVAVFEVISVLLKTYSKKNVTFKDIFES